RYPWRGPRRALLLSRRKEADGRCRDENSVRDPALVDAARGRDGDALAMPAKNEDLHGNVPDTAAVTLLLIDVINDFEYPGGEELFAQALPMAERLAALKHRAKQTGVPVLDVNDNYG